MKFKSVVLSAALLMFGVGAANASATWLGVNGGAGVPSGDFGDVAATGWQFGATGTRMVNDQWGFGGDVNYHMWNASDDLANTFGPGEELKMSALQATAHVMMAFPTQSTVSPYAKVGLGVYNVGSKFESPAGDTDNSESNFGFNFGGGMNFATSGNMRWGVNAAYHVVNTDSNTDVNIMTFGVNVLWGVGN